MIHEFRAMGTTWWIRADIDPRPAEALVRSLEDRLSRFRPESALSRLNRRRWLRDPVVAEVTRRALRIRALTRGAFDPGVGAAMAAAGYGRSFDEPGPRPVGADPRRPTVTVEGEVVTLEGEGALDLGGIAKGWAVDRVADALEAAGARAYVVDGGGDLRVRGGARIGVGPYAVDLRDGAVATSSIEARAWPGGHHVVDPRTGAPARGGPRTSCVLADDAATADALATALLVDPSLAEELPHELMLEGADGAWRMTPGLAEVVA